MNLGILQGRLSKPQENQIQEFPNLTWKKEFDLLPKLNLIGIEWLITNKKNQDNPFFTEKKLPTEILSVCVDTIINDEFHEKSFLEKNLIPVLKKMDEHNIKKVVIPLLEKSSIHNQTKKTFFLENILNISEEFEKIDFCFEFECDKETAFDFVKNSSKFFITYDTGNFTSFYGEKINHSDLINFFGNKIKNVHIKDRTYSGETKKFGLGNTNFEEIFIGLKKINYKENLILQLSREIDGNEINYINDSVKKIIKLL
jgi:hypothetical protein